MYRRKHNLRNRVRAVMEHTGRYSCLGASRLAKDAGVSKSALSKIVTGRTDPHFRTVEALAKTLGKSLRRPIDPRDLIAENGEYPTRYVCHLAGCKGCLSSRAYDGDGNRKPEYVHLKPGEWIGHEFDAKGGA